MPRVYVSSTFADLKAHREAVLQVLPAAGYDFSAMEYYPAADDLPAKFCVDDVMRCDLYLGLFAFRYGYEPPGDSYSITESEYRCARANSIPCLIFLAQEAGGWPAEWIDAGAKKLKIDTLRNYLKTAHTVNFFGSPVDLKAKVAAALAFHLQQSPRVEQEKTVNEAIAYLKSGAFDLAENVLASLLQKYPRCDRGWYYRAIALFKGRSPKSAQMKTAQLAEQFLQNARSCNPTEGCYDYCSAIIKHHYYDRNGLRVPNPSVQELLASAKGKGVAPHEQAEIAQLLGLS